MKKKVLATMIKNMTFVLCGTFRQQQHGHVLHKAACFLHVFFGNNAALFFFQNGLAREKKLISKGIQVKGC